MSKAKVTVHSEAPAPTETPTQTLIKEAVKETVVIDARGRKITLRKPDVLAQFRIIKAVGPEWSQNQVYMGAIMPIIFIAAIDGQAVFFPRSDQEVEAIIKQLGDEGLAAVLKGVTETWGQQADTNEAAADIKK
ncbi:MAG: hypothetical protein GC190_21905 [Alphaproteobacteria bacterium]|nr:hypothetical protein [Alphaproteobacteria bacterium]